MTGNDAPLAGELLGDIGVGRAVVAHLIKPVPLGERVGDAVDAAFHGDGRMKRGFKRADERDIGHERAEYLNRI